MPPLDLSDFFHFQQQLVHRWQIEISLQQGGKKIDDPAFIVIDQFIKRAKTGFFVHRAQGLEVLVLENGNIM